MTTLPQPYTSERDSVTQCQSNSDLIYHIWLIRLLGYHIASKGYVLLGYQVASHLILLIT